MPLDPAQLVGLLRGLLADDSQERWENAGAVTDLRADMCAAESHMIGTDRSCRAGRVGTRRRGS